MNKILIGILIVVLLLGGYITSKYNTLVTRDEQVKTAWAQVENQYQRRLDLIPNLVATVKGFAAQEQEVLVGVTEARANATKMNIDITDAQQFAEFQQAQGQLSSALSRLLAVVESYPDLKSNQNFLELQAQLEGTENRITVERSKYNEIVKDYNTYVRMFPTSIIAGAFGFDRAELFSATTGANTPPTVDFSK